LQGSFTDREALRRHAGECETCAADLDLLERHPEVETLLRLLPRLEEVRAARALVAVLAMLGARRMTMSAEAARRIRRAPEDDLGTFAVRGGTALRWPDFGLDEDTCVVTLLSEGREVWSVKAHGGRCRLPSDDPGSAGQTYDLRVAAFRRGQPVGEARKGEVRWLPPSEAAAVGAAEEALGDLRGPEELLALAALYESHGLLREALDACEEYVREGGDGLVGGLLEARLLEEMGLYARAAGVMARCNERMERG
jgi:hypothetical protein